MQEHCILFFFISVVLFSAQASSTKPCLCVIGMVQQTAVRPA